MVVSGCECLRVFACRFISTPCNSFNSCRVVKGIEKMLTVYASKKDTKNAKVVEDEITAKQHDMDQARARLHSLNLELEKKVKEDDPLYIQQELQVPSRFDFFCFFY